MAVPELAASAPKPMATALSSVFASVPMETLRRAVALDAPMATDCWPLALADVPTATLPIAALALAPTAVALWPLVPAPTPIAVVKLRSPVDAASGAHSKLLAPRS